MISLLADENFHGDVVNGLRRCRPAPDLVTVYEVGLLGEEDPPILGWAARNGRVLLTSDVKTMPHFAYERIGQGRPMPGMIVMPMNMAIGLAVEEIHFLSENLSVSDTLDRVIYLPF